MARYIKANPKVAAFLHLEEDRLKLKDGNYILWQADMTAFGPLPLLSETLTMIGGIALMPHEAKEEQDGTVTRPLPVATDERFVMDASDESSDEAPAESSAESDGDSSESSGDSENNESGNENNESEES